MAVITGFYTNLTRSVKLLPWPGGHEALFAATSDRLPSHPTNKTAVFVQLLYQLKNIVLGVGGMQCGVQILCCGAPVCLCVHLLWQGSSHCSPIYGVPPPPPPPPPDARSSTGSIGALVLEYCPQAVSCVHCRLFVSVTTLSCQILIPNSSDGTC